MRDFLRGLLSSASPKKVQETENQFRTLAESIPHLVWMADETGHIFWYNRRWYEYTGTTFEEMEGWGWKKAHDPDVLPRVMERWQGAIASGTPFDMVFPLRSAAGEFRPFLTRVEPVKDERGRIVRWFGTNTDINDQEKLRYEVESSEDKLKSFVEAASQGIIGISAEGRITLVNRRTEEMFGYSRDELLGQELEILLPERFRAGHLGHRANYFAEPRIRPMGAGMELAGRRKDGTEFPIEIGLSYVNTPGGPQAFGMVSDISERRRTAAELAASENKLSSFVEAASEAILGVSAAGRIILVNRRTEQMFGYTRGELLGMELGLLVPDRFRAGHAAETAEFFNRPRVRHMGTEIGLFGRRKDATEFPADIGLTHVHTPDGPLAFALVKDVSDVKKAAAELERINGELRQRNAELRSSEERFRSVIEAAAPAILGIANDGRITLVNRRTEEMLGYTREEMLGHPLEMLVPEHRVAQHKAHRQLAFAGQEVLKSEPGDKLLRRKDGSQFPYSSEISKVNLQEGPVVFGWLTDISESKKAGDEIKRINDELRRSNAELKASEEKFRACFEGASQPILGIAKDGRILMVNLRTEQMFGYSREEMLGQQVAMLYPERRASGYLDRIERAFTDATIGTEEDPNGERAFRRKDGSEFPYTAGVSHVNLPEGPILFGMINDITESKKAADELKHVNRELRRSYTELEQFAHVASHDLQEPLRMVTSYLQLIERRYNDRLDDDGREFIHFAVDGAKRMKALIKDLLEFSRTGTNSANHQIVEAGLLLDNALANLKTAIEESKAQIAVDPLPTIAVDPVLFTQVFQNLIANAIKFQKDTAPQVYISAQRQGRDWIFSVKDNGIGIEPHHRDRIFRIFERLHNSEQYSGSGIGLAITRKIVERHGGRIWVESQPGTGSTFHFSISAEMATTNAANSRLEGITKVQNASS